MPKYLFTSDIRISDLPKKIEETAKYLLDGNLISDIKSKSQNNNANTLSFYFNLYVDTKITAVAASNAKEAIRNFILKFQFPNTRTQESFINSINEAVMIAPYRAIVKLLYYMAQQSSDKSSFLTQNEILCFIFGYDKVYKHPDFNVEEIANVISLSRNSDDDLGNIIPKIISWNQYIRQSREFVNILTYSSDCFKFNKNVLYFSLNSLSYEQDKNYIQSLLSYNNFWIPTDSSNFNLSNKEYISYMDANSTPFQVINYGQTFRPILEHSTIDRWHKSYLPALRTKPFLLLAGISGTGKSQIVKEMAFSSCPDIDDLRENKVSPGNYCMIEVKPNWHDSTELLGYDSAIKKRYVVTKFVKFAVKAMLYPDVPFFVCLDEMNLAPVEQYFAEYLSVLESRKLVDGKIVSEPLIDAAYFQDDLVACDLFGLPLHPTGDMKLTGAALSDARLGEIAEVWHKLQHEGLCIPQNLIVIGTVNMDETTHQFSRKVIDRAMTFEMNEADFASYFDDKATLQYLDEPLSAELFISRNVSGNKAIEETGILGEDFKTKVADQLNALNSALEDTPFKVAYRVQNELVLYYAELLRENPDADQESLLMTALDDIMMMKVLPRIEGDYELLGSRTDGALKRLADFAANLPKSAEKIEEMQTRLGRSHFTSYWP